MDKIKFNKFDQYEKDLPLDFDKPVADDLLDTLLMPLFTLKDTGITQRTLSYWDQEGLLFSQGPINGKWRRYNFIEFVWLKILDELRSFGVPIKLLVDLRKDMFKPVSWRALVEKLSEIDEVVKKLKFKDEDNEKRYHEFIKPANIKMPYEFAFPQLLYAVQDIIYRKSHMYIILFKDGTWTFSVGHQQVFEVENQVLDNIEEKFAYETYINVSITNILKDFLVGAPYYIVNKLALLNENEKMILEIIDSGEYHTVSIKFKGKKPHLLNLHKSVEVKQKIVDVLTTSEYQTIALHQAGGKVVSIEQVQKVMLKNN